MSKIPKLDPRSARQLTNRECSKVIGGLVGALGTCDLVGPEEVRKTLRTWSDRDELWLAVRHQATRGHGPTTDLVEIAQENKAIWADPILRVAWRSIGGAIGGLRTMASEKAVRSAVRWWAERDDAWECFKKVSSQPQLRVLKDESGLRAPAPRDPGPVGPEGPDWT